MNIIDIFIALGHGLQAKFGGGEDGRQQYEPPPLNHYELDENQGRYYSDGSQERLYMNQRMEQGATGRF